MSSCVLDASAVLAYLQREAGFERVEAALLEERCHLLTINLAEALTRLVDWRMPPELAEDQIASMNLLVVPFDAALAGRSARLRPHTRPLGLSLADGACLALAQSLDSTAITADRAWLRLGPEAGCPIECIRPTT